MYRACTHIRAVLVLNKKPCAACACGAAWACVCTHTQSASYIVRTGLRYNRAFIASYLFTKYVTWSKLSIASIALYIVLKWQIQLVAAIKTGHPCYIYYLGMDVGIALHEATLKPTSLLYTLVGIALLVTRLHFRLLIVYFLVFFFTLVLLLRSLFSCRHSHDTRPFMTN